MKTLLLLGFIVMATAKPVARKNPMENEGLFEGDIMGVDPKTGQQAVTREDRIWPKGIIPYVMAPEFDQSVQDLILRAMRHIEDKSCVRFITRTSQSNYVNIMRTGGCGSYRGMYPGGQPLHLGYGCENFATIIHELMHAIGFEHEHSRSDRDDYVQILWENIEPKWHSAFEKLKPWDNNLLTPFDYRSLMLYGSTAFAKAPGKYSMLKKDGKIIPDYFDRTSMSDQDARRINMLYRCNKS